jgi:hypothetical protein
MKEHNTTFAVYDVRCSAVEEILLTKQIVLYSIIPYNALMEFNNIYRKKFKNSLLKM